MDTATDNSPQNTTKSTDKLTIEPFKRVYYPENKKIYDSACTIVEAYKKEHPESLDELSDILRQYDNYEEAQNLLKTIASLPIPQLSSTLEVVMGVVIIRDCLEENSGGYYDTSEVIDIKETLLSHLSGSEFYRADKNLRNLSVITDSDFIDFRSYDDDEYQIVYGTLYNASDCAELYNFIAAMCNTAKSPILRKAWIDMLSRTVKAVISNLTHCKTQNKEGELRVFIPFLDFYEASLSSTIRAFNFTLNVLEQIRSCDLEEIPLEASSGNSYPIHRMDDLMEEWADSEFEDYELQNIIHDEIARRGFSTDRVPDPIDNYRTKIIGIQKTLGKEDKNDGEKPQEVATIKRVGVLYCMLSQYGVDLTGMNKICSYVCADNKPFKGAKPENTIYTYLAHPNDRLFDKQDKIDYIKEKLEKYGIKVSEISELK